MYGAGVYLILGISSSAAPTPPSPEILSAKFHYELRYEIGGVEKFHNNTMICSFKGIEHKLGGGIGKERTWVCIYEKSQPLRHWESIAFFVIRGEKQDILWATLMITKNMRTTWKLW